MVTEGEPICLVLFIMKSSLIFILFFVFANGFENERGGFAVRRMRARSDEVIKI